MFAIKRKENESNERFIKRFTNKAKKLKIVETYLSKMYHKKKSVIKREKKANRKRTLQKLRAKEK